MTTQLLDIHPRELKFTIEVNKQSSCAIQLVNLSNQYVAYKVKTTSPRKYCVRPNVGIVKPNSKCDCTVTMMPQQSAPSDMQCKDKFLIQSTTVSHGTTEKDITHKIFSKDGGRHIEECKLRVVLVSPHHFPVLLPANGVLKQESSYEASTQKDKLFSGLENLPPMLATGVEDASDASALVKEALGPEKNMEMRSVKDVNLNPPNDTNPVKDAEDTKLKLFGDFEELKLKLNAMELKLSEADFTIKRLSQERSKTIQEKEMLKQKLATLKWETGVRNVQVGFPLLFVCLVALISLTVGYILHP
ncbi:hypothetical protein NMG60_11025168 [Bertholletia excelsa]